jgi:acetylornithine/succinyldiaminopimelate/putrescine aminotransferase
MPIFEPIQSLSGVRGAPEFFRRAAELARSAGALVIFDEVQTGLGRCGTRMLFEQLDVEPDLVTLAKGLAGGFPAGATLMREEVSAKLAVGDLGSTFGGGPLASALIRASLRQIEEGKLWENAERQGIRI